jgi:hypothetical protein
MARLDAADQRSGAPHLLRRTYASLRAASGDDPVYIAEQLGHEEPGFTFRVFSEPRSAAKGSPAPTWLRSIGRSIGQKSAESGRSGSATRPGRDRGGAENPPPRAVK